MDGWYNVERRTDLSYVLRWHEFAFREQRERSTVM